MLSLQHITFLVKIKIKIEPENRLTLEPVSLVLVIFTWCFTIPGIVLLANKGVHNALMDGTLGFEQILNIL